MKRIRITFFLIFVAIALPVLVLLVKSYSQVKTGVLYAYQEHAFLVLQMLNQKIYDDLSVEEQRSYSEYRFIRAVPVIGGEEITLSKLAGFPIKSHYSGMIGHFQLEPDGTLKTPVLPDGVLESIAIADRENREAVRDSIQKILLQLGLRNDGRFRTPVERNPSEGILNKIYKQNLKYDKKNILDSNNALANAVKFTSRYEQSSAKETFIFDVEPFQAIFNHQFIVFYRHIWKNNEPFIQGFVVNLATYLGSLIRNDVVFNLQDQTTTIEFGSKSRPFVIFGKIDKQKSSILSMPLQAPLGDMFFTMYLTPDEKFNAESMVVLLGFLMFAVLAGGLIAIYRLTESQLTLANKKQDLISAVSHEFKTPLTAIHMYIQMLQTSIFSNNIEKRDRYFYHLNNETSRLTRLIQNVLNLSKLNKNQWSVQLKKENPKNILNDFIALYSTNIEKQGFDITVIMDTCEHQILLDRDIIMQILMNLIDNSLKFAKTAEYKMIVLELRVDANEIFFVVRDYGPGIPKKELSKVFDDFYRIENEMTRKTSGTGIGLSMVKKLASLTKMKIVIENAYPGLRTKVIFPPISL